MKNILLAIMILSGISIAAQHAVATPNTNHQSPITTRAVVIGVSIQQDSLLPALQVNRQNAELYAAFLRSRGGGLLPADHVQLLTGERATMASFTSAIGWLEEESQPGDHIALYFAGHARLMPTDEGPKPHLFFADSPLALAGAGSMSLSRLCYLVQDIARKKNLQFSLAFDLHTATTTEEEDDIWQQWLEAFQRYFPVAWSEETLGMPPGPAAAAEGFTPILLDGLLGLADYNGDKQVSTKEAGKYLRSSRRKAPGGLAMFLAFSSEKNAVATVDGNRNFKNPAEKGSSRFPTLVGQELSRQEDTLLAAADERTRQWYEDFIITMKLGHLMEPAGRCTSDLYDSLLTQASIRPLHGHLRRQLAAALMDETQQALNDYLRTDTRELQRRWKHSGNYAAYPRYMSRVVDLLGEQHFMHTIIQCKKYYFEGLTDRLDFEKTKDSLLLQTALEQQRLALGFEPEAAFVLNEVGILNYLLKADSAKSFYLHAIELAPRWANPYHNISLLHTEREQYDSALHYAHVAVNLAPWNPVFVHNLGWVELHSKRYEEAETWLRRAASLDPADGTNYYDLGCTKAQQGQAQAAFQWLELAFKNGFDDFPHLKEDEDLVSLRTLPEWTALLKKYFPEESKD